jgi:hypothetical protein
VQAQQAQQQAQAAQKVSYSARAGHGSSGLLRYHIIWVAPSILSGSLH